MNNPEVLKNLKSAAEYREIVKAVRGWAFVLAIFGGLSVYEGVDWLRHDVVEGWIPAVIGGCLLVAAVLACLFPSPITLLVEAAAFGLVAAWDLLFALIAGAEGREFIIWGIAEIGIAVFLLTRLPKFWRHSARKPEKDILQHLDDLVKRIQKADPETSDDIIPMEVRNFLKAGTWRAKLAEDHAVFTEALGGHKVIFAPREEIALEDQTKPGKEHKKRKLLLHLPDQDWKVTMQPENFQRLEDWLENEGKALQATE